MALIEALLSVGLVFAALGLGYWLGRRHERDAQEEARDRLARIDPPNRRPGLPTNLAGEPSEVRIPRSRRGNMMR